MKLVLHCQTLLRSRFFDLLAALAVKGSGDLREIGMQLKHEKINSPTITSCLWLYCV